MFGHTCTLFLLVLLCNTVAFGQNASNKLDPLLKMVMGAERRAPRSAVAGKAAISYTQVLTKGDPMVVNVK